jgi:hypothetical protein
MPTWNLSHLVSHAIRGCTDVCAVAKEAFTAHPSQNGETYFVHARASLRIALAMFLGGWCAIIHAVFPFLAQRTASTIARAVVDSVSARRGDRELSAGMPLRGSKGSRSADDVGRVARGCGCTTRL